MTREKIDSAIKLFRASDIDIVSLDEASEILEKGKRGRKFVVFTLDDGYLDTYEIAWPLFEKYRAPFTVYIPTSVPDQKILWWYYMVDDLVSRSNSVDALALGASNLLDASSAEKKEGTYLDLVNLINHLDQRSRDQEVKEWLASYGFEASDYSSRLSMNWKQIREMSRSDLVTIGAHTVNHYELAKLTEEELAYEVMHGKEVLESRTGKRVEHFSYPFGGKSVADHREFHFARAAGFKTCTTTRHGYLTKWYRAYPERLPRILVNEETDLKLVVRQLQGIH